MSIVIVENTLKSGAFLYCYFIVAMNGAGKAFVKVSGENKTSSSSSLDFNGHGRVAPRPNDSSLVLATRPSRQVLSYWTCSKLCAVCFVAGVVFGYTLRGRVKRWASNILKKLT